MKRRLLLLRHAKSSWDDPSLADHDRPLSKRGRKAAAAMGAWIHARGLAPDLIYVSDARRATETLEKLPPWKAAPAVEVRPALYLAPAPDILALLRAAPDDARTLLLIGHNPGLHDLAVLLAGHPAGDKLAQRMAEAYPTGALAQFTLDGPWSRIGEGISTLTGFIVPRELKRAPAPGKG
jgi:phosphohistidine phosphatase